VVAGVTVLPHSRQSKEELQRQEENYRERANR
jgi:hypothetical protein